LETEQKPPIRPIYAALLVSAVSFVVYLTTVAPGLDFIDSGELSTDVYTLGICHPTGYPLFTLVGFIFSHLPIASSIIFRLNLMAAFFTAIGAGGVVLIMHEIVTNWIDLSKRPRKSTHHAPIDSKNAPIDSKKKARGAKSGGTKPIQRAQEKHTTAPQQIEAVQSTSRITPALLAATAAGLIAAFSATWWGQSTSIEVYPLHLALIPIVLYFFLRMLRLEDANSPRLTKYGVLFAVTLGLAFSNHMTTVLLAPACLYLYFAVRGFQKTSWIQIAWLAIPFCATLLLYLYLPIRAAQSPLMDWGHPTSPGAFMRHITGGQYKIWMFTGAAGTQWDYFWSRVPIEFAYIGLLPALLGIFVVARRSLEEPKLLLILLGIGAVAALAISTLTSPQAADSAKAVPLLSVASKELIIAVLALLSCIIFLRDAAIRLFLFTVLLFFGCLLYAINYSIHDIDSYFLLAFLAIAVWIGCGIHYAMHLAGGKQIGLIIGAVSLVVVLGCEFSFNYAEADESGNHMVDDYAMNLLSNLPQNAIIFSTQWDFWLSGAYYYQLVQKYRPDITVIDKAMLHDRAWYHAYLDKRSPAVMSRVASEEAGFLKYLKPFDNGDRFDTVAIGPAYDSFIKVLMSRNHDHPMFATNEVLNDKQDPFLEGMVVVPVGIAFRLVPKDSLMNPALTTPKLPSIVWHDEHYKRRNYYTDNSRLLQATPLAATAEMLFKQHRTKEALPYITMALKFYPAESIDGLSGRDLEFALDANDRFMSMQHLKDQIQQELSATPY
jgi:hypothetical protein